MANRELKMPGMRLAWPNTGAHQAPRIWKGVTPMIRSMALSALALLAISGAASAADGDAANGEDVFRKCRSCHDVGADAKNKIGPVLNGLIGRKAGTVEGFKYSEANKKSGESGTVWDEKTLLKYLEDPRGMIPGTTMAFAGLSDEQDRLDVVAFLKQHSKK